MFNFLKSTNQQTKQNHNPNQELAWPEDNLEGALEVIKKAFPKPITRGIILAYVSNPEITRTELDNILKEIENSYSKQDKSHARMVTRAVKNLYNLCSDEKVAQKIYLEVLNMSRKNLITLDKMIFQQLIKYADDEEFAKEMRAKTRSTEKELEPS